MNPKISILLPSIRSKNLKLFYNAALKGCQNYSFEIIIVSPYTDIPEELLKNPNIIYLHSYANPNICLAQAASLASGEFLYNVTDDGLIQENALDIAVDTFNQYLRDMDILNLVYIENTLDFETLELIKEPVPFSPYYWVAGTYPEYHKKAINPNWKLAPHFFMKRAYFEELGGLDLRYEYNNHSLHDILFRAQFNGSKVFNLPTTAFLCAHAPETTKDHAPVHFAQGNDTLLFNELYTKEDAVSSR
jgi:glycosyltransferase involved in cell wall biosynthesis